MPPATTSDFYRLEVQNSLGGFSVALDRISSVRDSATSYHLIVLDPQQMTVQVSGYSRRELELANEDYTRIESQIGEGQSLQVVLVSAGSIDTLRRACPNFFLDTQEFMKLLDQLEVQIDR